MNVNLFCYEWRHKACGALTKQVEIAVTSNGCLGVFWTCVCGERVASFISLDTIIRDIPASPVELTNEDKVFLLKAKISYEEEKTET